MLKSSDFVRSTGTIQVQSLTEPSPDMKLEALTGEANAQRHREYLKKLECFEQVLVRQPARVLTSESPASFRVACWNLERCKHWRSSAELLLENRVSVALLTEMDFGMPRSGNVNTTALLSDYLDAGYAFGVEFVELGAGDEREREEFLLVPPEQSLHGNAVTSHFHIDQALVLPLDNGGLWYDDDGQGDERRIGGRNATAVRVKISDDLSCWFLSVHFESLLGPEDRAVETRQLLERVEQCTGGEPVLIGGDFNVRECWRDGVLNTANEPMFRLMEDAGFNREHCNAAGQTTRLHPWHDPHKPAYKLDWFFTRGLHAFNPEIIPAVDATGTNLSDHELLLVDVIVGE